ncbi:MAG: lysophospholipid acyltransferase family protein [Planctomycetaceae bacterium]
MKIRNRTLIRAIAHAAAIVLRSWFRLVRLRVMAEGPGSNPFTKSPVEKHLYCLWHDAIFGMIFSRPHHCMAGLVSLHTDGAYVADMMEIFGIRPIRGSSGRRGAGAMREMMQAADNWHIAIATDGPRGPRHVVKDGILYLASQSGRAIVPTAFAARRSWRPRGRWTDMLIPWPFTRSWIIGSQPIHVPAGLKPDQLGPYRDQLQQAMDEVNALAERIASGEVDGFTPGWHGQSETPVTASTPCGPQTAEFDDRQRRAA